jgi:hypothetical protein
VLLVVIGYRRKGGASRTRVGVGTRGRECGQIGRILWASFSRHREKPSRRDGDDHGRRANEGAPRNGHKPDRVQDAPPTRRDWAWLPGA